MTKESFMNFFPPTLTAPLALRSLNSKTEKRLSLISRAAFTLLIGWLMLTPASSFAQQGQFEQNKTDQTLRSNNRVDPTSLGMNIQIPLGSYPGRGGLDMPITLNYSSKVWSVVTLPEVDLGEGHPNIPEMLRARYAVNSMAGWTTNLGIPTVEFTGRDQVYNSSAFPCVGCSSTIYFYILRIYVHMPGGGTVELRISDLPISTHSAPSEADFAGTYYAVDGSRMRYETATKTLFLPDGSRYILGDPEGSQPVSQTSPVTQYIDRNGNTLTYFPYTKKWKDTMNREISLPVPFPPAKSDDIFNADPNAPAEGDTAYTLTGVGGVAINYTLRWKKLADVRTDPNEPLRYTGSQMRAPHTPDTSPYLFDGTATYPYAVFNPVVLSEIVLPTGQSYKFTYNVWGEIDKLVYPTGGEERFVYGAISSISRYGNEVNRGVIESRIINGSQESVWHYAAGYANTSYGLPYTVRITSPDSTRTERDIYANQAPETVQCGFDNALAGRAYDERIYSASNQLLHRVVTKWTLTGPTDGGWNTATRDPRVTKEIYLVFEPGSQPLALMTSYEYDAQENPIYSAQLNVKRARQYPFVAVDPTTAQAGDGDTLSVLFASQPAARIEETDYLYSAEYAARNLNALPIEKRIVDANGAVASKARMFYDEPGYSALSYGVSVAQWTDPGQSKRGSLTTTRSYTDVAGGAYIEAHAQYDQFGNLRNRWDAKGNLSQSEYDAAYSYAYPTRMSSAAPDPTGTYSATDSLVMTSTYDFNTGLTLTSTDVNNQMTRFEYNDPLNRQTAEISPPGGGRTDYYYMDAPGDLYLKTVVQLDMARTVEARQYYDGLGRPWRTAQMAGAASIFVDTQYDQMGRVWKTSNPYRSGEAAQWTTTVYDEMDRVRSVTMPDSSQVTSSYAAVTSGSVLGTLATITDQAGKKKQSITDALGNPVRIIEDPNGSLNYQTSYTYDVLGNLRKVEQGQQRRYFLYDSLSRVIRSRNSEQETLPAIALSSDSLTDNNSQWSTAYAYDNNSNVSTITDARGTTTTCTYDALNRPTTRSYSGGTAAATPTVIYHYDSPTVPNSKGMLTSVGSSVSTYAYTAYDAMGRVSSSQQSTGGQTFPAMSYSYDLMGNMTSQTYPTGRVITQNYDNTGQLIRLGGQKTGEASKTYANSFSYTAHGAIERMRLGNGRWEHSVFNARLQPTEIGLGTSAIDSSLLKLSYDYGTQNNNGNLRTQAIVSPGLSLSQSYTYDEVNRLTVAQEQGGSSWKQTFTYDRYGNRRFDETNTSVSVLGANPTISQTTNRLDGYVYDPAGDMTQDAQNHTYTYNGENKLAQYDGQSSYSYDGDGRRVMKVVGAVTTFYVYNIGGQLVAEYAINGTPSATGTSYLTADNLKTPRVITGADGSVKARHDYLPFGEEVVSPLGGRSNQSGYAADTMTQKFTGKERDSETQLDYFGARYFSSAQGRFTSVDPLQSSANTAEPQTWNRFAYVSNNPLRYVDTNGMIQRDSNGDLVIVRVEGKPETKTPGAVSFQQQKVILLADDQKTEIEAWVNIADDKAIEVLGDTNCLGLTFADGEVWIDPTQWDNIRTGDGYEELKEGEKPQVGDVVIYRDATTNEVVHSATVTAVDKDGNVTEVGGIGGTNTYSKKTPPDKAYSKATKHTIFHKQQDSRSAKQKDDNQKRVSNFAKGDTREAVKRLINKMRHKKTKDNNKKSSGKQVSYDWDTNYVKPPAPSPIGL
jgi:RHS repeat-associated protein